MFEKIRNLLEMIRFSHTIFALPFAFLAAILAWHTPSQIPIQFRWLDVIGIVLAMVGARSAAMAFNRLVDRKIDAENPRTAIRHLPTGKLTVRGVLLFALFSMGIYFVGAALFLPNFLPLVLAVPVLLVLLGYSYAKRFTSLAHFWLGFALALAPICAWIAVRGNQVIQYPADLLPACLIGLVVLFWVAGFDIIYACQDFEYDRDAKLRSIPVRMGVTGALRLAMICHGMMLLLLVALGMSQYFGWRQSLGLSWPYSTGVALIGALLAYEHSLVRPNDLSRVNQAFFNVNAVVSVGLLTIVAIDLYVV